MSADEKNKPIVKRYYTVKLEVSAPVCLSYRILAESPEEALKICNQNCLKQTFNQAPQIDLPRLRKIRARIYQAGTSLLALVKNF